VPDLTAITDAEIRCTLQDAVTNFLGARDAGWDVDRTELAAELLPAVRALLDRPRPGYTYRCRVARWTDADSGHFDIDLGLRHWAHDEPLRLRGANAPDRNPAKRAATAWMRDAAPEGTDLIVRTHRDEEDKYGRLLADLWLPADNAGHAIHLNTALIDAGHGQPYTGGKRPEDY
jgi:endonuclease YncB( thermonuclease family)